jgi:O-antigen/teichoic acid export membrane protein
MVYYGLLFLAAELGTTTYLIREIAKDHSKTSVLVVHSAVLSGVLALVLALACRLLFPFVHFSHDLEHALYVIVWAVVPASLKAIQESVFIAFHRAEFLTYSALVAAVINAVATLYLLLRGYGVVSLVMAFTIVQCVVAAFYFYSINHHIISLRWHFSPRFALHMIYDIRAFTGSSLIQGFLSRPEIILLSLTKNDAQLGFYSAALRIVDIWQLIPRSFMTSIFPLLATYYHGGDQRTVVVREKSIKYLLAISLPVMGGLFVTARPSLQLLYGSEFSASVTAFRILTLTIPLASLWAILWRVLSARGEHDATFKSQLSALIVRVVIGYIVIRLFSYNGAALSTLIGMVILNVLLAYHIRRDGTRIELRRLAGRWAIATLAMAAVAAILQQYMPLWAVIPASAVVYVGTAFILRALSEDDIVLCRKLVGVRTS